MNTKKTSKLFVGFLSVVMGALSFATCSNPPPADEKETKYLNAYAKIEQGEYVAAYELFVELGDYKDSAKEASRFRYVPVACVGTYTGEDAMPNETTTVTLNENNLPANCFIAYADGTQHTCTYTYNANGKLTRIFCTDTDGDGTSYEAVHNANGDLEKETIYYLGVGNVTLDYTYNAKGEVATLEITGLDDYTLRYEYSYAENGNLVETAVIDDGENYSYNLTYNENNVLIQQTFCDEAGNILTTEDYAYDGKGNLLSITYTEDDEVVQLQEYTYDEKGRMLSDSYRDLTDGYVSTREYTYTADGRTEKFRTVMPDVFEDTQDLTHKLVYIPFEYAEGEWNNIIRMY